MRRVLVLLSLVLTTSAAAVAGNTISTDGSWWNSLSDEAKVSSTITGTIAYDGGLSTGYSEGTDDQREFEATASTSAWDSVVKSDAKYAKYFDAYKKASSSAQKSLILNLLLGEIEMDVSTATPSRRTFRPGADFRGRTIGELVDETGALYTHHAGDTTWDYSVAVECLDENLKKREFPYGKCGMAFNK